MKKVLQIVLVCVLFAVANNTSALTISKTVRWHGGWCPLCNFNTYSDQQYTCAWNPWYNYYPGDANDTAWNCTTCRGYFGGNKYFWDFLPSGATVTGIQVTVCEADCGDSYVAVYINGIAVGTYYPTGNCYCGGTSQFSITASNVSAIMANYHIGGWDTVRVNPNSTMCFSTAQVIFTYVLGANLNTFPAQYIHNIPYCPGDSVNVPYYAAGSWVAGNVFTAQLSDASGVFPGTDIGTLTSTVSGTIHCQIPSGTPDGTGYSIRVKGSNPATVGADTVMNITITHNSASISANGPLSFCAGGNVILTGSTGNTWLWSPGGQTTQSITVTTAGIYSVHVASASGCNGTSPNDTVVILPRADDPGSIYGPEVLCVNATANFSIPVVSNATSYLWTVSQPYSVYTDTIISGQGGQTVSISFGAITYPNRVKVWAVNGCGQSVNFSYKDVALYGAYGDGTWIGGISNDWFIGGNWCGGVPNPQTNVMIDGTLPCISNNSYPYYMNMPVINAPGAQCQDITLMGDGVGCDGNLYNNSSNPEYLTIMNGMMLEVFGSFDNCLYPGGLTYFDAVTGHGVVKFTGPGIDSWYNSNPAGNGIFYGSGGNMIFGYSNTAFYDLIVDKGTDNTTVLENVTGNYSTGENIVSVTHNLQIVNGTLLLSCDSATVTTSASPLTIPSTGGLDLNGGWLTPGNYSILNNGDFIMDIFSDSVTVGTTTDNMITNNGNMYVYGGNLKVASQIINQGTSYFEFNDQNQSLCNCPSTITLNAVGTTSNTKAVFDIDAASRMDFLNGTMIFHKANSGVLSGFGNDLKIISGSGTKSIGGGVFQFGDASTPANTVFCVKDSLSTVVPFNVININSYNNPTVRLDWPAKIMNNLNLTTGILNLNYNLLTINSNLSGAITRTLLGTGYILAEDTLNNAAISWPVQIGHVNVFPFGNSNGVYIPVEFENPYTNLTDLNVQIATYAPQHWGHQPYPPTVVQIRDSAGTHLNDSLNMVNRFWEITAPLVSSTNTANVKFYYANSEKPVNGDANGLRAQRWVSSNNGWMNPSQVYGSGGGNGALGSGGSYQVATTSQTGYTKVNKMNHCSPWTLTTSGHPLPIELLTFTAQYNGKTVDLNWSTASELNNDYFIVSKTRNQEEFDWVAQVAGAGNSDVQKDYYAEDKTPFTGTSYYQLTQKDFNGNSTQSGLVPIVIGNTNFSIVNINNDNLKGIINVYINDNNSEQVSVIVYDLLGNQMRNISINSVIGINHIEVNSDQLARGIYFISISNSSQRLTGKIAN